MNQEEKEIEAENVRLAVIALKYGIPTGPVAWRFGLDILGAAQDKISREPQNKPAPTQEKK